MIKERQKFDKDLQFGQKYENELQRMVEGKVEVKTDRIWWQTGNVFIEYEDRGKPSGISVTEAKYYAICLWHPKRENEIWVLIPTDELKDICQYYDTVAGGDNYEARGYLVPDKALLFRNASSTRP